MLLLPYASASIHFRCQMSDEAFLTKKYLHTFAFKKQTNSHVCLTIKLQFQTNIKNLF